MKCRFPCVQVQIFVPAIMLVTRLHFLHMLRWWPLVLGRDLNFVSNGFIHDIRSLLPSLLAGEHGCPEKYLVLFHKFQRILVENSAPIRKRMLLVCDIVLEDAKLLPRGCVNVLL